MIPYQAKSKKLAGTSLSEVKKNAARYFRQEIESKSKRRPYIRSAYFKKEKIFFEFFWDHIFQKSPKERFKRLKFLKPAVEVVKRSRNAPSSKNILNTKGEILHRFAGLTFDKEIFYVQIKEDKKGRKNFMSCFPPE